jgi:hypothetical protein
MGRVKKSEVRVKEEREEEGGGEEEEEEEEKFQENTFRWSRSNAFTSVKGRIKKMKAFSSLPATSKLSQFPPHFTKFLLFRRIPFLPYLMLLQLMLTHTCGWTCTRERQ